VYVIDGRVDDSHPEFDDVDVIFSKPIVPPYCTGPPEYYHPTAVASVLAGQWVGVAKKPTIVSVQAGTWETRDCVNATVIREALYWTLMDILEKGRQKTSIVNLSWSEPNLKTCQILRWFLHRFWLNGVTVVNSAGNGDDNVQDWCPGRMGTVITVGAMDQSWNRWGSSNSGPYVDIFAPGADVLVADYHESGYTWDSGTSLAAPMVAGMAAYLLALEGYHHPWGMLERLQELGTKDALGDTKGSPNIVVNNGI
jgi:subtilisin family serine protease